MQFSNKLNFLMNITNTSNKELAEGISVDRSLISLLRSGKRKPPRNHDHIQHMAAFFARRCSADFQFHALAEMLEKPELRPDISKKILTDKLYNWMLGDTPMIEHVFENIVQPPSTTDINPEYTPILTSASSDGQTQFFYGTEGMREALRSIFDIVSQIDQPCPIYLISDLNMEWLFEDYQFMKIFSNALHHVFRKGYTLCHIMPSLNYMNRYVESLRYWLPIYASGRAEVYYYPRLRDNLYRRSLMIFPEHCVQASTGIGNSPDLITVNSTNASLIDAYFLQFRHELALCKPALLTHTDPLAQFSCFRELLQTKSPVIQNAANPSPYTLPVPILEDCLQQETIPEWKKMWELLMEDIVKFEERISHTEFFEICPLATPEEIRAGKVWVGFHKQISPNHPRYTPETYALHLQHILDLMDKYENYHLIPMNAGERQDYNLFSSESGLTLLLGSSVPPYMLEIRRPEFSLACYEYLMRRADMIGYTSIRRTKARIRIKELIQELRR